MEATAKKVAGDGFGGDFFTYDDSKPCETIVRHGHTIVIRGHTIGYQKGEIGRGELFGDSLNSTTGSPEREAMFERQHFI